MFTSRKVSRQSNTGFLSRLAFCWVIPILWKARKQELKAGDPNHIPENESARLGYSLSRAWKYELYRKVQPRLTKALTRVFGFQFLIRTALGILNDCILRVALGPSLWILLGYFNGEYSLEIGYQAAGALILISFINLVVQDSSIFLWEEFGMRIRIALTVLIYQKVLKLNQFSLAKISNEQVTRIFNNDVNQIQKYVKYIPYLIVAPIQAISVMAVLWFYLGPSALIMIAFLVLLISTQAWVGKEILKYEHQTASKTDTRVRHVQEVVNGIELIKMSTCDTQFIESVSIARRAEVNILKKKWVLKAFNHSLYDVSSKIIFIATLLSYVLLGNKISAISLFVTLTLITGLREALTWNLPLGISGLKQIRFTLRRIEAFLLLDEDRDFRTSNASSQFSMPIFKPKYFTQKVLKSEYSSSELVKSEYTFLRTFISKYSSPKLSFQRASAGWSGSDDSYSFSNISLEGRSGDLLIVMGPSGSGKSSILQAILAELPLKSGRVEVTGSIAYVSQVPWIFPGTVQENIVLGQPYDQFWYNMVIEACALSRDIQLLPYGDQTLVGLQTSTHAGLNARINLARAVYSNADVYLLDDPLRFVDSETANQIFDKCICGLLKFKLVLLTTDRSQYFDKATEIVILKKGSIDTRGSPDQINSSGWCLDVYYESQLEPGRLPENSLEATQETSSESSRLRCNPEEEACASYGTFIDHNKKETPSSVQAKPWAYWNWKYLTAGNSGLKVLFLLIVAVTFQGVLSFSDYWLKIWTTYEAYLQSQASELEEPNLYFEAYSAFLVLLFLLAMIRNQVLISIGMRSSVALHNAVAGALIRAPLIVFDANLSGRLLTQLTHEIRSIDEALPQLYYLTISSIFQIFGSLTLISLILPIMSIPTLILVIVALFIRQFYVKSAASVKRMESAAEAPIYRHLSNSINGLSTIRAYRAEKTLETQFNDILDEHTAACYTGITAKTWLKLVLDFVLSSYLAVLIYVCLTTAGDSSAMGLVIYAALNVTLIFSTGVSESAELDIELASIERLSEYSEIRPEGPLVVPTFKTLNKWPCECEVDVIDLSVRNVNHPSTPQAVTFHINPGEKIGIVGPGSAAEMSTIVAAIFRLVEPVAGIVRIDDIDISTIGLHDLRSKLTFIPQNPIVFNGTVRQNLDPFNKYTDKELWSALAEVQLLDYIDNLSPAGLDTEIGTRDLNISSRDKQYLYLARATLSCSKIIMLDQTGRESSTNAQLMKTIEEKFKKCTIITITNGLGTVMQCDRVCVMESGTILEFDDPYVLLQNPEGYLHRAARKYGVGVLANLLHQAGKGYEERNMRRTNYKHERLQENE